MSIVVITKDKYQEKRTETMLQEQAIDNTARARSWALSSNGSGFVTVSRVFAVLLIPVILLWALIVFLSFMMISLSILIFNVLGRAVSALTWRTKNP